QIPQAFARGIWSFMSQTTTVDYYRPLQTAIYTVAYQIGGLSPFVYHVINVLIHSAVTILVYLVCLQFARLIPYAFIVAALFAAHPVHTEAVSWIAGVGDLECGFFYFAALYTFLRGLKSPSGQQKWLWV